MRRRSVLALIAAGGAVALAAAPGAAMLALPRADGRFRGLSALHLDAGGTAGLALSDRGWLFEIAVDRDAAGRPAGVTVRAAHRLRGTDGAPLPESRSDAEALAVLPDGMVLVGLEGRGGGRILAYDRPGAAARWVPVPAAFAAFPGNGGIEAMAAAPDGTLYVVPEDAPGDAFPVWRRRDGWAEAGALPRAGGFRPVAADIGPDGALWVLERRFGPLPLFASRIRRSADLARWDAVLETPAGRHGNLEGLTLRPGPGGGIVAAMVSDDNLLAFQRSEIVEYVVPG